MANGSVGYNLNHIQCAVLEDGEPGTWVDFAGSQSWEPSINIDTTDIQGDGQAYVTAYGVPTGEGDFTFIDPSPTNFATVNGGVVSTYGTGANEVTRYEQRAEYIAIPFAISDWVPNIDKGHNPDTAGMRTIVGNATAEPVTRSSGQESTVEWTVATRFTRDAAGNLIVYEWLASEPTFTNGVDNGANVIAPTP